MRILKALVFVLSLVNYHKNVPIIDEGVEDYNLTGPIQHLFSLSSFKDNEFYNRIFVPSEDWKIGFWMKVTQMNLPFDPKIGDTFRIPFIDIENDQNII